VSLDDRHALVTGGGRGIGRAIAAAFVAAGATVSIVGRSEESLIERILDGEAHAYGVADVTDADAMAEGVTRLSATRGPIDILVNNAGGAETGRFVGSDPAMFQRMLALNLTSAIDLTRLLLPGMIERGFGRIINVASTAGLKGYAYVTAYCTAKHGLVGFTRALAMETARTGVTVNAVCPGFTDTGLVRDSAAKLAAETGKDEAAIIADFVLANPQARLVRPQEVASAVVWLCGIDAAAVTGQTIAVAGGEV
jgi:3-hydroxybutyrate dehydrogenase